MEAIETFTVGDLSVEIHYDEDPGSPREHDNLTKLVCEHTRYELGDRGLDSEESEILARRGLEGLERYLRLCRGALIVQPLYLYDHSVLRMSTGSFVGRAQHAEWDSGIVGVAYVTEKRVKALCGDGEKYRSEEWLKEAVEAEVKEYDSYLAGEVYGYVIERDGEHVDSCWGYVGDIEYVREEARSSAEAEIEHEKKQVELIDRCMAL